MMTKFKNWTPRLLLVLLCLRGLQCAHKEINTGWDSKTPAPWAIPAEKNQFSFMAYNVENLFDTQHDPGKEDFTFLPLSLKNTQEVQAYCLKQSNSFRRKDCTFTDWTEPVLEAKLKGIAKAIFQVREQGPDILFLEEVENLSVLKRLNKDHLAKAGYITEVLIEGDDIRGIDVGMLSRFPIVGKPVLHKYREKTRGILEVKLKLPSGDVITTLGLHFPSQGNPTADRRLAVTKLKEVISGLGPKALVIAGGDGNITTEENRSAQLLEQLETMGILSHRFGCDKCVGTHNYQGRWDYLDWIFVSNELAHGKKYLVVKESISTPNRAEGQLQSNGLPNRFDIDAKTGITDHLPIFLDIRWK